jgi:hypothetical protein
VEGVFALDLEEFLPLFEMGEADRAFYFFELAVKLNWEYALPNGLPDVVLTDFDAALGETVKNTGEEAGDQ